ncbi:hypothetical protein BZB76_5150 [Actinomadura pelletieri DSM 43383]|uniref:Uncharacterized protein n=1 Tax=Actinomadura pelletieri DSM 43383 TaxID=1120940 RepID=A0A495QFN0_9ACTN|nr:hypothetical protein [Actinomadura pelletieri]RKS70674.1 hypothetical protein BZB76_5150 [Actinomadura pelletieri DSM 43383]
MGVAVLLVLLASAISTIIALLAFILTYAEQASYFCAVRNGGMTFVAVVTLSLVVLGFLWTAKPGDQPATESPIPVTRSAIPSAQP